MVFDQGEEWILSDGLPNTHVWQSIYRDIMKGLYELSMILARPSITLLVLIALYRLSRPFRHRI